jgi:hypothetical protein
VGEAVPEFSLVGDGVVAVVHCALPVALVVSILSSILCPVLAAVVPFSVLESVEEVAVVDAVRFEQDS